MKRALIMTVGLGAGVENGLRYSVKYHRPTAVWFIYTSKSMGTVDKILESWDGERKLVEIPGGDENDVEMVYSACCRVIRDVIDSGFAPTEITADFTSGTKPMSAGLVLASVLFRIEFISYVYGERDKETGRAISGTERTGVFSPRKPYELLAFDLFASFFNKYQFEAAIEVLESQNFVGENNEYKKFLLNFAQMCSLWDRFNFSAAKEYLRKCDRKVRSSLGLDDVLNKSARWLHELGKEGSLLGEAIVFELYWNAERRFQESKFDDAVARLYRLLEKIFQIEYLKEFGKETKVGLVETITQLKQEGKPNEKVEYYFQNEDAFKKMLYTRNNSILAHGEHFIKKEIFENFSKLLKPLIKGSCESPFPKLPDELPINF